MNNYIAKEGYIFRHGNQFAKAVFANSIDGWIEVPEAEQIAFEESREKLEKLNSVHITKNEFTRLILWITADMTNPITYKDFKIATGGSTSGMTHEEAEIADQAQMWWETMSFLSYDNIELLSLLMMRYGLDPSLLELLFLNKEELLTTMKEGIKFSDLYKL